MQKQYTNLLINFYSTVVNHHSFSQLYQHSVQRFLNNELNGHQNKTGQQGGQNLQQVSILHQEQPDFEKISKYISSHNLYQVIYFSLFYRLTVERRFKQLYSYVERVKNNLKKIQKGIQQQINKILANKINKFYQYLQHLQLKIEKSCKIYWIYLQMFKEFQNSFYNFTQIFCSKDSSLQTMKNIKKENYQPMLKLLNVKCFIVQYGHKETMIYGDGFYNIFIGYRQQKYFIINQKQYQNVFSNKAYKQEKHSSKGSGQRSSQNTQNPSTELMLQKMKLGKIKGLMDRNAEVISNMADFKDSSSKSRNNDLSNRA